MTSSTKRPVGRPRSENKKKVVGTALPVDLILWLITTADKEDISLSSLIRNIIENHHEQSKTV